MMFPPVAELLPHAPPMLLLDAVLEGDADTLSASLTIRPGIAFFDAGHGVPAHVGIEYMAQACGAWAGLRGRAEGRPVSLGLLLGTRRYLATEPWFAEGEQLTVLIRVVFREGPMGVFDCRIVVDGRERATANLTVYQPEDDSMGNLL